LYYILRQKTDGAGSATTLGADIDTTIENGRVLMRIRWLTTIDEPALPAVAEVRGRH
jgi:hypothetical protein